MGNTVGVPVTSSVGSRVLRLQRKKHKTGSTALSLPINNTIIEILTNLVQELTARALG